MNTTQTPEAVTHSAGEGAVVASGQTSVKSATPTDRESTEAGNGEPRTLSGGRGANLPAAPSDQLALDLSPLVTPDVDSEASLEDKFEAFHSSNPHVLVALEELAHQYLAAGRKRISIGMLYEVLRYTAGLRTTGDSYSLNNNHRAFYARLIVERNPAWADAFQMRAQRAAA